MWVFVQLGNGSAEDLVLFCLLQAIKINKSGNKCIESSLEPNSHTHTHGRSEKSKPFLLSLKSHSYSDYRTISQNSREQIELLALCLRGRCKFGVSPHGGSMSIFLKPKIYVCFYTQKCITRFLMRIILIIFLKTNTF